MDNNMHLDAMPREPMTRWNRRSDIQLTLNLFSRGVKYNPNATTDNITFIFFTDGARKYKCGREEMFLHEIRINEDGSVTCFIDRPNFNPGRLHVEVFVSAANMDFNDKNFKICKPSCLPILIVDGHSDDVDPNVSVALSLPYIEVTIWDALVDHGYLGTSDEFWRKFVGLMAGNSINADGAIHVVLASMGEEYDGVGVLHEQAPGECVYDGTRYQIAYMDDNGVVSYYSPSSNLVYCNAVTNKLYRWNNSGWAQISATGGGGGSQDISGKADLLAGVNMLAPSQWPKVVLRNVTDTMLDDLSPGDIYFDSGYLFLYTNGDPVELGHPNQKTIYYCLADDKLYRWNGNIFQPILSAVSYNSATTTLTIS